MPLSRNLDRTLHRAIGLASERRHKYATLEHLLLALTDDGDAVTVMRACAVDLDKLRHDLAEFLDKHLSGLVSDQTGDPKPTAEFQRAIQRAAIRVQSKNGDEVTGADVLVALFSERESHAVHFLNFQDMTRLDAVNFISNGIAKVDRSALVEPPPVLPAQSVGPHVEVDSEGVIAFAPPGALDADGNHLPQLHALHPELRELARELTAVLGRGNAPHAVLCERVAAYAALMDRDLQEVDFRRLYAAGVRLANAAHATERAIADGDLPPLELDAREGLDSLLALHGSFILSTAAGTEALLDEERYRRRPAEERQFRADAVTIAAALRNRPDLVAPDVAEQVLGAAQEIGEGRNPERSIIAGRATLRNVMIGIVGGAIGNVAFSHAALVGSGVGILTSYFGLLAVSETVKKTHWFQRLTGSTASMADKVIDAQSKAAVEKLRSGLLRQRSFVTDNELALSRLAGEHKEFEFLGRALRWLNARANNLPPDDKKV